MIATMQKQNPDDASVKERPAKAAVIRVSLSEEKTEAYIEIEPPEEGGSLPTKASLVKALLDHKVIFGMDQAALSGLADQPVFNEKVLVAKGRPVQHGENGTCAFLVDVNKRFKPKERPDGSIDFRELNIIENVHKDQVLCTLTPPTQGTNGHSVLNAVLHAKRGKSVPSVLGKNVKLGDDGTSVLSCIDGQVDYDGRKLHVNESQYIQNVDNSTGNIKVLGNAIVHGSVLPGFCVEAGGNVEVHGSVSSAKITAGGSIILRSGMTGSELNCGGDLSSRFVENCKLFVKGSITAEYILNSQIKCGKSLQVVGSHSKILGGSCLAGRDIVARDIGSQADVRTELELGTDTECLERQQELVALIPNLERQCQSLKPMITLLKQLEITNRITPEKQQVLDNAVAQFEDNTAQIAEAKEELEAINESVNSKGYGRVVCSGTIYPGARLKIGTATRIITEPLKAAALYLFEGEIKLGSAF